MTVNPISYQGAIPSPETAALFAPVVDWLARGAPHEVIGGKVCGFNMQFTQASSEPDFAGHSCGTAMCIGGAIDLFNRMNLDGNLTEVGASAGMSHEDRCALFYAMHDSSVGDMLVNFGAIEEITPAMAHATLTRWLETGLIRWDAQEEVSA